MLTTNVTTYTAEVDRLTVNERRGGVTELECELIETLTSKEAGKVTRLMIKIYLKLIMAPAPYWEQIGVLHFTGEATSKGNTAAWKQLLSVASVPSAPLRRALVWMDEQGIITYRVDEQGAIRITFGIDEEGRYLLKVG